MLEQAMRHDWYYNLPCKGHQRTTFLKSKCSWDDLQILLFLAGGVALVTPISV